MQVAAENAARFLYLHQESVNHLHRTMMINPSSLYDHRLSSLYQFPPRFEHCRLNHTNGFSHEQHSVDETLILDLSDIQRLSSLYQSQSVSPPRFEHRRRNHRTNGFTHQHSVDGTLILDLSEQNMMYYDENFRLNADGLSEETIVRHMKTRIPIMADNDEVCVVCQVSLFQENEKIASLHCGHEFHAECIKKWFHVKNNCPMCKATGLILD